MSNYSGYGLFTIGGQERPVFFGPMQAKVYCQTHQLEWTEYQDLMASLATSADPFILANIVHSALVAGCKHDKVSPDFDEDDVLFWIGELNDSDWEAFFKVMQEANGPNGNRAQKRAALKKA
jgi:hypothetical protein